MPSVSLMLKQAFWVICLCLSLLSFPLPSLAITVQDVPNPRYGYDQGWVTDMADLLNSETKATLNRMLSRFERINGSEIAVVTVPNTSPAATPKQFATELFKYWGIGKKGINNGVLFLISKSDRRVEIETGYGIEKILPNSQVAKIINQQIIPRFREGDFPGGTIAGTQALILRLEGHSVSSFTPQWHYKPAPNLRPDLIPYLILLGATGMVITGGLIWAIAKSFRPLAVAPEGRSRKESAGKDGALNCANCQQPMEKLGSKSLLPYLSQPEQVAQQIGSVSFDGWRCPNCQNNHTVEGIHIRSYVLKPHQFITCPTCQELTVERTSQILESPTFTQNGKRKVTEKCHCCSYVKETEEVIFVASNYGDGSYADGGGGSWGGDSGGFGGGDSGGGGDGGGW